MGRPPPSEAAPSEADFDGDDFPSLEALDDDNTWKNITNGKRKSLVGSQRYAKQVKAAITGFSKVSAAASPFNKKA